MSDQQQIPGLINDHHSCSDNGQSDAANAIKYELEKLIEQAYSDQQLSQNVASDDNSK
jgi:hypothetical protein